MPVPANMTLVFSEDFNSGAWSNGLFNGWKPTMNWGGVAARYLPQDGDRQCYFDPSFQGLGINPFTLNTGVLTITALPLSTANKPLAHYLDYSSGMLSSYGLFSQQYGYFEMRAQLPKGKGLRPQFYLAPVGGTWPPQIDVMKVVGAATTQNNVGAVTLPPSPTVTSHLYVATGGSDTNTGSSSLPFKTITKALSMASPGTMIHVAPGTYAGNVYSIVSGTADAPIRVVSDVKWGAKIIPKSSDTSDRAWNNGDGVGGNYVIIDGFEIDGTEHTGGARWFFGVYSSGTGARVVNCKIHDIAHFAGADTDANGGSAIELDGYYNAINAVAESNVIYNIGPSQGVGNLIHGIYVSMSGARVTNNLVYQIANCGIKLWNDARSVEIVNNTIFATTSAISVGGGQYFTLTAPTDYNTVVNNLVYDNTNGVIEQGDTGTHNRYLNNLAFGNSTNWSLLTSSHSGTVSGEPLFVNYVKAGGGDYRLTSNSPAVNAGAALLAPVKDLDGKYRGQGTQSTGFDIGCYEYSSSATVLPPNAPVTEIQQTVTTSDLSVGFHTFAVNWQPDFITYYVDDVQVYQEATPASCKVPMFMVMQLAVGGGTAGIPDGSTNFPAQMRIDYVKAYSSQAGNLVRNVKTQYGAIGDGIADDRTAIQSALDSANPGDTIYLPGGNTFAYTGVLTVTKDNITIKGDGTNSVLRATSKSSSAIFANAVSNITIQDLKLEGAMSNIVTDRVADNNAAAAYLYFVNTFTLKNVYASGFAGPGLVSWGSSYGTIDSCNVGNNSGEAILVSGGSHHVDVVSNYVYDSGDDGVSVKGFEAIQTNPNNINITTNTIVNQQNGHNIAVSGGDTVIITENMLDGNDAGRACLYLASEPGANATREVAHVSVQRNIIRNGGDADPTGSTTGQGLITIYSGTSRVNNNIAISQNNLVHYGYRAVRIQGVNNDTIAITTNNIGGDVSTGILISDAATNVITSPNDYVESNYSGPLPGAVPTDTSSPAEARPMVDFIKSVTKNGRFIGRSYQDLIDPNFEQLVVCLTGTGGPTQVGQSLTTVNSNDFTSTYTPWAPDPAGATLSLDTGTLKVIPTGHVYVGAVYSVQGLTPGTTVKFSGQAKYTNAGNGAAWIIWDMGNNMDAWKDLTNHDTYNAGIGPNVWYNFSDTATVPPSGNVQFGLVGAVIGQPVYFDNVTIESQNGGINFNVLKYNDFTSTYVPWQPDTGSLALQNGALAVVPDLAYKGAVYQMTTLTPGDTITFRGKFWCPNGGSAAVIIWDVPSGSEFTNIANMQTYNSTPTPFQLTVTVPSSGRLQFGLISSLAGKATMFDDVEIDKGSITQTQGVSKDLLGNSLFWSGNILTSTAQKRGYDSSLLAQGGYVGVNLPSFPGNFMIEGNAYVPASGTGVRGLFCTKTNSLAVRINALGNWEFWDGTTAHSTGVAAPTTGRMVDWRLARSNGVVGVLIDGALIYTQAFTTSLPADTLIYGTSGASLNEPWNSNLQELRVYKDIGTLKSYTPITKPYSERLGRYAKGVWSL